MSAAEDLLAWQMDQVGIHYLRQHRFCPGRQWRFDFVLLERRQDVAVEVEGGIWCEGRHVRGAGFVADCEKYNQAALRGWFVLRFTPAMVEAGEALKVIEKVLGRG